jgi:hypothetical protein
MDKSKSITREQALEMLKQMELINKKNNEVCIVYLAAIDFLESKGLKKEFEEYLVSKKRFN